MSRMLFDVCSQIKRNAHQLSEMLKCWDAAVCAKCKIWTVMRNKYDQRWATSFPTSYDLSSSAQKNSLSPFPNCRQTWRIRRQLKNIIFSPFFNRHTDFYFRTVLYRFFQSKQLILFMYRMACDDWVGKLRLFTHTHWHNWHSTHFFVRTILLLHNSFHCGAADSTVISIVPFVQNIFDNAALRESRLFRKAKQEQANHRNLTNTVSTRWLLQVLRLRKFTAVSRNPA